MRERNQYEPLPGRDNWPALAAQLMGPALGPDGKERRRMDTLELARALLVLAGERDLAAMVPVKL